MFGFFSEPAVAESKSKVAARPARPPRNCLRLCIDGSPDLRIASNGHSSSGIESCSHPQTESNALRYKSTEAILDDTPHLRLRFRGGTKPPRQPSKCVRGFSA